MFPRVSYSCFLDISCSNTLMKMQKSVILKKLQMRVKKNKKEILSRNYVSEQRKNSVPQKTTLKQ